MFFLLYRLGKVVISLAKSSIENKKLEILKKNIKAEETPSDFLVSECQDFISGIIITGIGGTNDFYREYCAYASSLSINFVRESKYPMSVSLSQEKGTTFNVNAVLTISIANRISDILFIISHEMKHILSLHLQRYNRLFSDEVIGLFINLATDTEVNESLVEEYYLKTSINPNKEFIPKGCITCKSIARIIDTNEESIINDIKQVRVSNTGTVADYVYRLLAKKCEETLGYSIQDIQYRLAINKTSFKDELYNVVDNKCSSVFKIKDMEEAVRFCKELVQFLGRSITSMLSIGGGMGGDGSEMSVFDIKDILKETKELMNTYKGIKSKGFSPFGHKDGREELNLVQYKVQVPWESILCQRALSLSRLRVYSKKRINRRQPFRLELSGVKRDKIIDLVVAIDESGSISNEEYNYYICELESILKKVKCNLFVYKFTMVVSDYVEISYEEFKRNGSKLDIKSNFDKRTSGGTNMQCVVDDVMENKKINVDRCMMTILTDGGMHMPDFKSITNRMWIIVGEGNTAPSEESERNVFPIVSICK